MAWSGRQFLLEFDAWKATFLLEGFEFERTAYPDQRVGAVAQLLFQIGDPAGERGNGNLLLARGGRKASFVNGAQEHRHRIKTVQFAGPFEAGWRHCTVGDRARRLMVASLRYNDTFVKTDGVWLFSERLLYVDWMDERALA